MRLVYIAPVPWGSFSQRPHRFVQWFHARFGADVLWVNPYPTRLARWSDAWRVLNPPGDQQRSALGWLTELATPAIPLEPLPGVRAINHVLWRNALRLVREFAQQGPSCIAIGKPSIFAIDCLKESPFSVSLYDMMDDFPAFYGGLSKEQVQRSEAELIRLATHVCYSSNMLRGRCEAQRSDGMLVSNGLDTDTDWQLGACPPKTAAPVLGYVGTMASWFDWEWVAALAQAMPQASIRLIGPMFSGPTCVLPSNVDIQGQLEHAAAVEAMRGFDVGLIPFRVNTLTDAVDPIKFYEYHALGLGVLSTPFGEMACRDQHMGVYLSDGGSNLHGKLHAALAYSASAGQRQAAVVAFVQANSWQQRFESLNLDQRLPRVWPAAHAASLC